MNYVQQAARARFPVRVWRYSNGSESPRNDEAMIFLLRCLLCGEQRYLKTQTRNPACATVAVCQIAKSLLPATGDQSSQTRIDDAKGEGRYSSADHDNKSVYGVRCARRRHTLAGKRWLSNSSPPSDLLALVCDSAAIFPTNELFDIPD